MQKEEKIIRLIHNLAIKSQEKEEEINKKKTILV